MPVTFVRFTRVLSFFFFPQLRVNIFIFKNHGRLTLRALVLKVHSEAPPALSLVRSSSQPVLHWQPVDESHQSQLVGSRRPSRERQQFVRSSAGATDARSRFQPARVPPPPRKHVGSAPPGAPRGCVETPERSAQRTPGFTEVWRRGARSGGLWLSGAEEVGEDWRPALSTPVESDSRRARTDGI